MTTRPTHLSASGRLTVIPLAGLSPMASFAPPVSCRIGSGRGLFTRTPAAPPRQVRGLATVSPAVAGPTYGCEARGVPDHAIAGTQGGLPSGTACCRFDSCRTLCPGTDRRLPQVGLSDREKLQVPNAPLTEPRHRNRDARRLSWRNVKSLVPSYSVRDGGRGNQERENLGLRPRPVSRFFPRARTAGGPRPCGLRGIYRRPCGLGFEEQQ